MDSSELAELDAAVARALGYEEDVLPRGTAVWRLKDGTGWFPRKTWRPSTDWSQGGLLIEQYRIDLCPYTPQSNEAWHAMIPGAGLLEWTEGPTPLIAAMRAFVASKK